MRADLLLERSVSTKKNRSDAYVSTNVLDADIFICGSKDRNRALEGDLVAVELLDVDEVWDSKREKEEKRNARTMPRLAEVLVALQAQPPPLLALDCVAKVR